MGCQSGRHGHELGVRGGVQACHAIMCIGRIGYHLVSPIFLPLLLEEYITGAVGHTLSPGSIGQGCRLVV